MMQYLTYEEYRNYGGNLTEPDFTFYEFKARKRIDLFTFNRVQKMQEVPESVKLCMYSIINIDSNIGIESQSKQPRVASFNTDGYSQSFSTLSIDDAQKSIDDMIRTCLQGECDDNGTPLLYRGFE